MEFVIDANVIISALISTQGKTFDIILNDRIRLYAPEFLLEEINKYKKYIIEKAEISDNEFESFLYLISSHINFVPCIEFEKHIPFAEKITPDLNDAEYFALALHLNCGIWTNDKMLGKQDKVRIFTTEEIIKLF